MARWTAPPEALSRRWKSVAAALLALVALAALPARAETRFALVIGNGPTAMSPRSPIRRTTRRISPRR